MTDYSIFSYYLFDVKWKIVIQTSKLLELNFISLLERGSDHLNLPSHKKTKCAKVRVMNIKFFIIHVLFSCMWDECT